MRDRIAFGPGYVDGLMFMGLVGASIAHGSRAIWYSDGTPKTEADLMRVPWVKAHLRREYRERQAWRERNIRRPSRFVLTRG